MREGKRQKGGGMKQKEARGGRWSEERRAKNDER